VADKMSFIPIFKIGLWNAWIFMSIFIIQMVIIMFADKRIRGKSHLSREVTRNRLERYAGILGNILWLLALGYSVVLPFKLGSPWFYIGLSVFIIGLIVMITATINFMATPVESLITKGVYQISRHPMYLATFIICFGTGIAAASWLYVSTRRLLSRKDIALINMVVLTGNI
jgi:protein-S-isoprenylcysteine O-methyltransferase Ste14